eukprot:TRINITY_DN2276_c0_g1_i1.p1 TRINITY_DN2276_c0_g1~~TRINITY_DN2276_c0_g1_i1.p1  ORF type:complete len:102 (+),score=33.96 TRINITY_DN2276_c0_g1_i1:52-357(+)
MVLLRPLSQTVSMLKTSPMVRSAMKLSTSAARTGGSWSYRCAPSTPPPWTVKLAPAIMTVTWWWVFHGMMTEPAHIFPFWDDYPDPEQWTDQQLGIPADEE